MLAYQSQDQGSTAALTMYGSRDYVYAVPVQHHWSDPSLRSKDVSAWTSTMRQYTRDIRLSQKPSPAAMATSTVEFTDLSRLVDIEFAAFRDEKINHHLSYRDGSDSSHLRRTLRAYRKYMNNLRSTPEDKLARTRDRAENMNDRALGFRFRKVQSPEGGEIIAFCKSELAAMTADEMSSPLDAGHEGESQMNRDWFALNERCHREYCGTRKHLYFGMLATHPDHQHQGAASMLMDELVTEADRLRVEIYCEATKTGRPLYEKYGFVAVKEIRFATADYGTDIGEEHQTVMVRGALAEDGKRRKVRSWDEALAERALVDMF